MCIRDRSYHGSIGRAHWTGEQSRYSGNDNYVNSNGIEYVQGCDELYQGNYQSVEEFIDELELIDYDIPSWLVIDYEATWDSAIRFDYDKIESSYGYDFWRIN